MNKYVGKYRILIERDESGEPMEFTYAIGTSNYRECKIYRYGSDTLSLYVIGGSVGMQKNMIKRFEENHIEIIGINSGDFEANIIFNERDLDIVASFIIAKTTGTNINPKSIKNHPFKKQIIEKRNSSLTLDEIERRKAMGNRLKVMRENKEK